jgi:RTX calcium-binding nonapeptide repeat (4 copies)
MLRSRFRHGAAIAAAVVAVLACAGSAAAKTKFADLRMVTHTGRTLAEFRQYTGSVTVHASRKADCFGPDNPSSDKRYRLDSANALGILKDALASDRALRPLVISDAFVDDGFGLGVCSMGGFDTVGFSFWDLITNHVVSGTGASLTPVRNRDRILWYFTSGNEPASGPTELVLKAPASANPGEAFTAKVLRFTGQGKSSPAAGVSLMTGDRRVVGTTGPNGEARVRLGRSATLDATGTANDIPSNHVSVCVNADEAKCPEAHGKLIYGSKRADRIKGTRGSDRIKARGGADVVNLGSGGEDRLSCGGGRDRVILDRGDRNDDVASSCERVSRR